MSYLFFPVPPEEDGARLDKWVLHQWPHIPYQAIHKSVRKGDIRLNGKPTGCDQRIREGDVVRVYEAWLDYMKKLDIPISERPVSGHAIKEVASWLIHEDENFFVFHKPIGVASQGGTGQKVSMDQLISAWAGKKVYLVHRLDKQVGGVFLVARSPLAARKIADLFAQRHVHKTYWGVCHGIVAHEQGQIGVPLCFSESRALQAFPEDEDKKQCLTHYNRLEFGRRPVSWSWLELFPVTGRKHQIRAHLQIIGHPLQGDFLYGRPDHRDMLHLHCHRLSFLYDGVPFDFSCEPPEGFFDPFLRGR